MHPTQGNEKEILDIAVILIRIFSYSAQALKGHTAFYEYAQLLCVNQKGFLKTFLKNRTGQINKYEAQ